MMVDQYDSLPLKEYFKYLYHFHFAPGLMDMDISMRSTRFKQNSICFKY